ncbi:hypothetical protein AMTRI_Chr11g156010 [Amborella trichopoda]|uniref:growth-regulating factor 7-like n=1 Tax=Amborella trichopoda TaxID=13333 RepID=UPI0005D35DFF|nr:growth-regulating factor 7-like [Amborella trichopoda]|eukprot:XP_011624413.1 growth-regulating factor 7-like [Amborella trichopoda]
MDEEKEPGRCRRTDGKMWRCSRDVVPDQKYCERHLHRGSTTGARSRKPVEQPPQSQNQQEEEEKHNPVTTPTKPLTSQQASQNSTTKPSKITVPSETTDSPMTSKPSKTATTSSQTPPTKDLVAKTTTKPSKTTPSQTSTATPPSDDATVPLPRSPSSGVDPGRCQRTDGKRWRCSKDALPNKKYCEGHVHRGRVYYKNLEKKPKTASDMPSTADTNVKT